MQIPSTTTFFKMLWKANLERKLPSFFGLADMNQDLIINGYEGCSGLQQHDPKMTSHVIQTEFGAVGGKPQQTKSFAPAIAGAPNGNSSDLSMPQSPPVMRGHQA